MPIQCIVTWVTSLAVEMRGNWLSSRRQTLFQVQRKDDPPPPPPVAIKINTASHFLQRVGSSAMDTGYLLIQLTLNYDWPQGACCISMDHLTPFWLVKWQRLQFQQPSYCSSGNGVIQEGKHNDHTMQTRLVVLIHTY